MEKMDEDGDIISQLPQHIFQHILSFLAQKEAAKTCALSKSCRYLWSGRPNVEFREKDFKRNRENFTHVVERTLQGYVDQNLRVHKFCVHVEDGSRFFPLLAKWVPIVACALGVNTLELKADSQTVFFQLPSEFFKAQSLRDLHLQQCRWGDDHQKILFKHLRTLRLESVIVQDGDFEKIMWSCPLIEHVVLEKCDGLRTINYVSDHNFNLNYFEFDSGCFRQEAQGVNIQIYTPSVATIIIKDCPNWFHHQRPSLFLYPNLKSLRLDSVRIPKQFESLDCFSTNFPCLEELVLYACFVGFEEFKLSSASIKHLRIKTHKRQSSFKAVIDAPKIVEFEFVGGPIPSVSFAPNYMNSNKKWKSYVQITCLVVDDFDASSWFHKMSELLTGLSQSEITLRLILAFGKRGDAAADFPDRLVPDQSAAGFYKIIKKPVAVEHLRLELLGGLFSASSFPRFIDALFSIGRPRKMGSHPWNPDAQSLFRRHDDHQVTESLFKILRMEKEECCRDMLSGSSWQQHLEEVNLEVLVDENEAAAAAAAGEEEKEDHGLLWQYPVLESNKRKQVGEWHPVHATNWLEYCDALTPNTCLPNEPHQLRFQLKWCC